MDSGASCHATPNRKFFHDYVLGDFGHVLFGDDEPCKIVGMGKVHILSPFAPLVIFHHIFPNVGKQPLSPNFPVEIIFIFIEGIFLTLFRIH